MINVSENDYTGLDIQRSLSDNKNAMWYKTGYMQGIGTIPSSTDHKFTLKIVVPQKSN